MKCETMNSVLTFVLGAFVVFGVILALQTINRTREIRSLQIQAANINANYMRLQALASDVNAYNQKTPSAELAHILQAAH
jgi:large-conductance mechanosensitive channel